MKRLIVGSPEAMSKEPCLEQTVDTVYSPWSRKKVTSRHWKKARVRDIDDPQGEDRDQMLRGFGFDPDNPNDPYSGGQ